MPGVILPEILLFSAPRPKRLLGQPRNRHGSGIRHTALAGMALASNCRGVSYGSHCVSSNLICTFRVRVSSWPVRTNEPSVELLADFTPII